MLNRYRRPLVDLVGIGLMIVGLLFVLAGYLGVREQQSVVEQIPYLASGGVGGLAFLAAGAALLHLTRQARIEERVEELAIRQEAMEEALEHFILAVSASTDLQIPLDELLDRRRRDRNGRATEQMPQLRSAAGTPSDDGA
jgi:hypothetical protein